MKTLKEQIANRCIHFMSPVKYAHCHYGVNFRNCAKGEDKGWMGRLPCIRNSPLTKQPVAECQGLRWPTEEEIDRKAKEIERMIEEYL